MGTKLRDLWAMVWPPARRRKQKAQEQVIKKPQRWIDERKELVKDRAQERIKHKQSLESWKWHMAAYPLNGVGTHKVKGFGGSDGEPITISELRKAVLDRLKHVAGTSRNAGIDRAGPGDVAAMTSHLDPSILRGLTDYEDQVRQRHAASSIRNERLNLDPEPSLHRYATAVAEAAVKQMPGTATEAERVAEMVCARAILLRSADLRWQRQIGGASISLSHRPPRLR